MPNHIKRKSNTLVDSKFSDRNQRIFNFLNSNPVGVLSTVNPNGDPHGVVIYFATATDFSITFLTRSGTRKFDNLKHNPRAMLTVFEAKSQTCIQVTGQVVEVIKSSEINRVAGDMLAASLKVSGPGLPPIAKLKAGDFVAFKIEPVQIRMAVYSRPDPGDYDSIFESIESFDFEKTN